MVKKIQVILILALAGSLVLFVFAAAVSLQWRCVHDSPLMIYAGWLMDQGFVPYRQLFDMNMPGTYFIMRMVGGIFGWKELTFRCFDLFCLLCISGSTFFAMSRFGRLSAAFAALLFPLWYLGAGPLMSLQREYLALVPFSMMLAAALNQSLRPVLKMILVGFLTGAAMTIKPQFFLLCVPVLAGLLCKVPLRVAVVRLLMAGCGLAVPLGSVLLYLWLKDGLASFLDMAVHYWPLYTHLTKRFSPIYGFDRLIYLVRMSLSGWLTTGYFFPAIVGLYALSRMNLSKWITWGFGGLFFAAAIYPAIAGQFWRYHWIPLFYVATLLTSFCAAAHRFSARYSSVIAAIALISLIFSFGGQSAENVLRKQVGVPVFSKGDTTVADGVSAYFRANMNCGDTAQPLDWTSGAVHGMLLARMPLATRFMYDFHFYHHIDSAYTQRLRRNFIEELKIANPRYIVQVLENRARPNGQNTTQEFPELDRFISERYGVVWEAGTYRILEHGKN